MSKPTFLYGEVNLPPIPAELLTTEVLESLPWEKWMVDAGHQRKYKKDGRILTGCGYGKQIVDYEPLINWIKQQVPPWPSSEWLTIQHSKPNAGDINTTQVAHTDVRRKFALNYMITLGGAAVTTSYYRDPARPLCRGNKPVSMDTDTGTSNYDNLECIATFQAQASRWYLIRTNVLHEVDHLDSIRSSITIPYFDDRALDYFKQHDLFKTVEEHADET